MTGFGDPVFNPSQRRGEKRTGLKRVASVTLAYTDFWQGAGVDRARLAQALPQLPDTADELNAVAKDLGVALSDIHLGADASETTVKRAPLADYRIVYFATHGLVAGDVKGVAEPSLALSIPKAADRTRRRPADRERSRAAQAQCRLGGAVGLQHHRRRQARRRSVVGTGAGLLLCRRAGAAGLPLGGRFGGRDAAHHLDLRLLKADPKLGRAEALRRAMLAYLDDASSPQNAYPAFWGPFALIGEGQSR